jgi:hypothetical protein
VHLIPHTHFPLQFTRTFFRSPPLPALDPQKRRRPPSPASVRPSSRDPRAEADPGSPLSRTAPQIRLVRFAPRSKSHLPLASACLLPPLLIRTHRVSGCFRCFLLFFGDVDGAASGIAGLPLVTEPPRRRSGSRFFLLGSGYLSVSSNDAAVIMLSRIHCRRSEAHSS